MVGHIAPIGGLFGSSSSSAAKCHRVCLAGWLARFGQLCEPRRHHHHQSICLGGFSSQNNPARQIRRARESFIHPFIRLISSIGRLARLIGVASRRVEAARELIILLKMESSAAPNAPARQLAGSSKSPPNGFVGISGAWLAYLRAQRGSGGWPGADSITLD